MISDSLIHQLRGRGFLAERFETGAQAKKAALSLIGTRSVGIGGSITVRDLGLPEALTAQGNTIHAHWYASPEELPTVRHEALHADVYLCSANAVLTDGRLVNIDGTGNRVAAITFGPRNVIFIVGMNKLCQNLDAALARARSLAAPVNTARFDISTPCKQDGVCHNCLSPDCICNYIHYLRHSPKGKHQVILVGESLGY